jgi:predicted Zn-dependent protease
LPVFLITALAAGVSLLAPSGCSVNPATGRLTLTGLTTTADEVRIGREEYPQIVEAFGGVYNDSVLQSYVSRVGQSLARHTERTDLTYSFTILDSPIANAVATPGGYIYVTRGLLALANNEAELAGVLGHELGHVVARHHAQQQSRQTLASVALTALALALKAPPPALLQGTQLVALVYLARFSREQEYEADQLGARYMARAGYDPHALATLLTHLQVNSDLEAMMMGQSPREWRFDFLATHPNTAARVKSAIDAAKVTIVANPAIGRDAYLDAINGMLYGEPAAQGYIRGRIFAHPLLRITFEVPPRYQLFDTQRAVYAVGPGDAVIVFDAEPHGKAFLQRTMSEYLSASNPPLANLTTMRINGLEAATGSIIVDTKHGKMELRLAAIRTDPTTIYRFRFLTPVNLLSELGPGNIRTLRSFRTLTADEAAVLKPLRVRVVTVKKGDSIETLADRMAFERYRTERFCVLNGLEKNAKLVAGQRVKIVTE